MNPACFIGCGRRARRGSSPDSRSFLPAEAPESGRRARVARRRRRRKRRRPSAPRRSGRPFRQVARLLLPPRPISAPRFRAGDPGSGAGRRHGDERAAARADQQRLTRRSRRRRADSRRRRPRRRPYRRSRRRRLHRGRRTSSLLGANGKRKHEREQDKRWAKHRGGEGYRHGGPLVSVHCHRRTPQVETISVSARDRELFGADRNSTIYCAVASSTTMGGPERRSAPELPKLLHFAPVSPSVHQGYWWLGSFSPPIHMYVDQPLRAQG